MNSILLEPDEIGYTHSMQGHSHMTMDPRIPTTLGRSTGVFPTEADIEREYMAIRPYIFAARSRAKNQSKQQKCAK